MPTGNYGPGSLILLTAPSITAYVEDIRLAGQHVDPTGNMLGEKEVQEVQVMHEGGVSKYHVQAPAFGAGLLVLRQIKGDSNSSLSSK